MGPEYITPPSGGKRATKQTRLPALQIGNINDVIFINAPNNIKAAFVNKKGIAEAGKKISLHKIVPVAGTYSRHMRTGATICDRRAIPINMGITRVDTATTANVPILKINIHNVAAALTRLVTFIDFAA